MSTHSTGAVFLSYASQDTGAAHRICEALRAAGIEVWFDQSELTGGAAWDTEIRRRIKECALFVPLISANTEQRLEGYFRLEWRLAEQRTHLMAKGRPFLVPVVVDSTLEDEAHVPDSFLDVQWTRLIDGEGAAVFAGRVRDLLVAANVHADRHDSRPASAPLPSPALHPPATPVHPGVAAGASAAPALSPFAAIWRRIGGVKSVTILVLLAIIGAVLWRSAGSGNPATAAADEPNRAQAAAPVAAALAAPRTAVAVLPFANLTGDASMDYLGDGMAEELINTLTRVPGLKIPARTSAFAYKGRNVNIREIARDLHVGTILEGSVRAAGKRIRITAQLINAEDGLHLWSQTYDEEFTDIFKLQDKLATQIASALNASLTGGGEVLNKPPTEDVEAYRLYLQGTELLERPNEPNGKRALELFQQAIDRDAKFVRAYEGLARGYLQLIRNVQPAEPEVRAAERAARQALALDPNSASALSSLAVISFRRGRWLDMEEQSRASLKLADADALVHVNRASILQRSGKLNEAQQELRKAYELAPSNAYVVAWLALNHSGRGLEAEARQYAQMALDLGISRNEASVAGTNFLGMLRAGRYDEAAKVTVVAFDLTDPEQARTVETSLAGYAALADPGKRAAALATYARVYPRGSWVVRKSAPIRNRSAITCTGGLLIYALLGELDIAYELGNQCLATGQSTAYASSSVRIWIPEMRPFRRDPRFHAYIARFGDLMAYYEKYGPPDDCELTGGKLTCH